MNLYCGYWENENDEEYKKRSIKVYLEGRKKFKNNNLKFMVLLNRDTLFNGKHIEAFKKVLQDINKLGVNPGDLVVGIDNNFCKKTFSKQELQNLKELSLLAKKMGITAGVYDYKDVFEYKDVENADKIIKQKANEIKKQNYSPLEKLLHAYLMSSQAKYNMEDEDNESESLSRSVYGVLNGDKIVCAGFSEVLKAITKELDDSNLKVFANLVGTKYYRQAKLDLEFHQNNIVYIKDEKYKIDGFYYLDLTFDNTYKSSLKYFLTEIGQIRNIYEEIVDWNDAVRLAENKYNKEETNQYSNTKSKEKFYHNANMAEYASVSKDKVSFCYELFSKNSKDVEDNLLSKYLFSRQDFKDHVLLRQTMKDNKPVHQPFDKIFEANAKKVEENIGQIELLYKPKEMFKYLKKNSPHVDIGPIQNALQTVFATIYPNKSKDKISKMVYDIMKTNIVKAKDDYYEEKTLWSECEELK